MSSDIVTRAELDVPLRVSWTSGRLNQAAFLVSSQRSAGTGVRLPRRPMSHSTVVPLDGLPDGLPCSVERIKIVHVKTLLLI